MGFKIKYFCWVLIILALLETPTGAFEKRYKREILKGINYIHIQRSGNTHIHVLKVNLNQPNLEVKPAVARHDIGTLATVRNIAEANHAIAAINGTFFDRKRRLPIGLIMIDGTLVSQSILHRSSFGLTSGNFSLFGIPNVRAAALNMANQEIIKIWGINRPRKDNEIILYTPDWGERTGTNNGGVEVIIEDNEVVGISEGNSPIPEKGYVISFHGWSKDYANAMAPGTNIFIQFKLSDAWENACQIITGGPRLLEDYKIVADSSIIEENFKHDLLKRNARTAVGIGENNELILLVFEGGRKRWRRWGATYRTLAQIMLEVGAKHAIGLDGGGTSTMYINGKVVNQPAEEFEGRVSNALIVKVKE